MPLRVMEQLGLQISRPYRSVCGVDSKPIEVCGLVKDLGVSFVAFPCISVMMNVVVVDIPDAWGFYYLGNGKQPWVVAFKWICH